MSVPSSSPPIPSPAPTRQPRASAIKTLFATVTQPRVFTYLLLAATIISILSALSFLAYLFLPGILRTQTHYTILYISGITGLAIAEACQIAGILVLIAQWASKQNTEKKPRELAVLLISLVPYVVIVVFLMTLGVYLYLRIRARSPESQREAREELKDQVVNTIVDYSSNLSNQAASTAQVAAPRRIPPPTMKEAVRQIIGPTAEKSVSGLSNGLLVATVVVLILSTVTMGSIVTPQAFHGVVGAVRSNSPGTQGSSTSRSAHSTPAAQPTSTRYYSVGVTSAQTGAVSVGPDGNLWFAYSSSPTGNLAAGTIGVITPGGTIHTFPFPQVYLYAFGTARSFAVGPDGNFWYTDFFTGGATGAGFIGRLTPTGARQQFPLPFSGNALAITLGPDGHMWFTATTGNSFGSGVIGTVSPSGAIRQVATGINRASDIISGPDGNVWFTGGLSDTIGRITPSTGKVRMFTDPRTATMYATQAIASGPDGNVWIGLQLYGEGSASFAIESIAPDGTFHNFAPLASSATPILGNPENVTVEKGGAISCGGTLIGQMTSSHVSLAGESTLLCGGSLVVGKDGKIWFVDGARIGEITP